MKVLPIAERVKLEVNVTDRLADYFDNDLVPDAICKKALGDPSDMTWWRWQRDERLDFPEAHYIRGRIFRRAGDVRRFRQEQFGF